MTPRLNAHRCRSAVAGAALAVAALVACRAPCAAADIPPAVAPPTLQPVRQAVVQPESRPNSILFFAGRMSTTDNWSTLAFNLNQGSGTHYDNYIVGGAYSRDLLSLGYGFYLGAEIGVADRFGNYPQCCIPIVKSDSLVHSGEIWAGAQIRYAGFVVLNSIRIGAGMTFGFSYANTTIGRERQWEIENGSAPLLYYWAPELDFSSPEFPNVELVLRLQHRSGAATVPILPTLAKYGQGYNGNVAGLRYRF